MTVPYPPGGLPRLVTQLTTGAPTEGEDCGVCAVLNAALLLSDGRVGPQSPGEDRRWVEAVRIAAGNDHSPMLIRGDITQVLNSPWLRDAFQDEHLKPLQATYHWDLSYDSQKAALRRGWVLILAVDYGVLRAGPAPCGSRSFSDGHVITFAGAQARGPKGRRRFWTNDGDSLFDGRPIPGSAPGSYPRGYQESRLRDFRKAAAGFGTIHPPFGKATCVVVRGGIHP